jgi:hypothetical protein
VIASAKLLLRVFVVCSIPFAVLIGPFTTVMWLTNRKESVGSALLTGLVVALVSGALMGMLMALYLGGWQILTVKRLGFPLAEENLAVRQRRQLTLDLPFAEAFSLCLDSIRYLGRSDISEQTDFESGVILAEKRMTMKSWGEGIRFQLRSNEGGTVVEIECRPRMGTAVVDLGTSLRNMDSIVGFLLAHGATAKNSTATRAVDQSSDKVRGSADHIEESPRAGA